MADRSPVPRPATGGFPGNGASSPGAPDHGAPDHGATEDRPPAPGPPDGPGSGTGPDDTTGPDDARGRPGLGRRLLSAALSIGVVVAIFGFLVPKLSGVSLADAVEFITPATLSVTVLAGLVNLATNWPPMVVSLPGLRTQQAAVANLSSAAVSNTVPEGGAVATGVTYAMLHSWGFSAEATTISILTTGVWTNLVRYSIFAVSLTVVAAGSPSPGRDLALSLVVLVVMVLVVAAFTLVLRSESFAGRLGEAVGRVLAPVQRRLHRAPSDTRAALVHVRAQLLSLVRDRWRRLTAWMVLSQVSMALVLLVALRAVGIGPELVSPALVFVAFTGASLAALVIPVPGGVGVVEAAYLAILGPSVPDSQQAQLLAAIVLFRIATWLLPVPLGAGTYLFWRFDRRWRRA